MGYYSIQTILGQKQLVSLWIVPFILWFQSVLHDRKMNLSGFVPLRFVKFQCIFTYLMAFDFIN